MVVVVLEVIVKSKDLEKLFKNAGPTESSISSKIDSLIDLILYRTKNLDPFI